MALPEFSLVPTSDAKRKCSFCSKSIAAEGSLAREGGTGHQICEPCIKRCFEVYEEKTAGLKEQLAELLQIREKIPDSKELDERISATRAALAGNPPLLDVSRNLSCSFCAARERDVKTLLAAPTLYICDGCVGAASAVLTHGK